MSSTVLFFSVNTGGISPRRRAFDASVQWANSFPWLKKGSNSRNKNKFNITVSNHSNIKIFGVSPSKVKIFHEDDTSPLLQKWHVHLKNGDEKKKTHTHYVINTFAVVILS